MKYKFRLIRKKIGVLKRLADKVHPAHTDMMEFFNKTLHFVGSYVHIFYGDDDDDDSTLCADGELVRFYDLLLKNLGLDSKRFRLKKFNLCNLLAHFMCNATVWDRHCDGAVSFEYSAGADFTGLKIVANNQEAMANVQHYIEYCLVVLNKGYRLSNMQSRWQSVLDGLSCRVEQQSDAIQCFADYFEDDATTMATYIEIRNKERFASYNACNPKFLQSSICL